MRCLKCSTVNTEGHRFCVECGAPFASVCPSCGTAVGGSQKFCGGCGAALAPHHRSAPIPEPARPARLSERRRVSVMFADLVGFTALSESRDPEEVRELLTRYFAVAQTTVQRYGGTIEKFIGDAVMAVWGVPATHEDDAERAVRAALDLVKAVAALSGDAGSPELRLRAGVVSGEAATTVGATDQAMVAGDTVNTAARVQSLAPSGAVWVDSGTRQATTASISYTDAGSHELKGKTEPVQLFSAERVVAGAGGTQRLDGLEAPFTGRDRELLLLKELFHASAEERRARLVSVTGTPGIGKTRLAWEFFKYLDGVASLTLWHVGRCLSYGEGVAYRALAEVLRMRLRIAEADPPDVVRARIADATADYVADAEDRAWLEPRLGLLLGVADDASFSRDELFAAWRLFFERLSDRAAVVIVFEDVQWADGALLDFIDYLLDWSANSPLYIVTLSRPEIAESRPGWGSGRGNATSLHLDPLGEPAMRSLVNGLVDGLPEPASNVLVERAEGVPLYAVETVRMLIDQDLVIPRDGRYQLADESSAERLTDLDVPASLRSLVASRIDGLPEAERVVLSDAAVLGLSFTRDGLDAVLAATGTDVDVDLVLASLARKGILGLDANPRSPERGQYRFMQSVLRQVPYDTMSRRDRKARHLAVAAHLSRLGQEELAALVASHYLDAADAVPGDADVEALRVTARDWLVRAADRAAALGAPEEGRRYYQRALELATGDNPLVAVLSEHLGSMVAATGDPLGAVAYFTEARALYGSLGDLASLARVAGREGDALWLAGHQDDGLKVMEPVFETVESIGPHPDLAALAALISKCHAFAARPETALLWSDRAATLAEHAGSTRALVLAWNYRAVGLMALARPQESMGLLTQCVELLRRDLNSVETYMPPYNNLALLASTRDLAFAEEIAREGLVLARRRGDRGAILYLTLQTMFVCLSKGDWDEAERLGTEIPASPGGTSRGEELIKNPLRLIRLWRGDEDGIRRLGAPQVGSAFEVDMPVDVALARGVEALNDGRVTESAEILGAGLLRGVSQQGPDDSPEMIALPISVNLDAGRTEAAERLLDALEKWPAGARSPYLAAQVARFRSLVDSARGSNERVEDGLVSAERVLGDLGMPFARAEVQLDLASWLVSQGRADAARQVVEPAIDVFERLGAAPNLAKARDLITAPLSVQH